MKYSLYTFLFFISGDIEAQVLDIAKIQLIHSSILRSKHLPNISSKALNVLPKRRIMQEYLFGRIDDYHTLEPLHFCSVTLSFNNTVIQKSQTDILGRYHIKYYKNELYNLQISCEGYEITESTFEINDNGLKVYSNWNNKLNLNMIRTEIYNANKP